MSSASFKYLVITGHLALVAWFVPGAISLGLFYGIVPGLILLLMPNLFLLGIFYSLASLTSRMVRHRWRPVVGIVAFIGLIALANLPLWLINRATEDVAAQLVAEDRSAETPIEVPDVIAILDSEDTVPSAIRCSAICLRLLFNGAAKEVVVGRVGDDGSSIARAHAWSLERRSHCPVSNITDADARIEGDPHTAVPVEARIALAMAQGTCLVEVPVRSAAVRLKLVSTGGRTPPADRAGQAEPLIRTKMPIGWRRLETFRLDETGWRSIGRRTAYTGEMFGIPAVFAAEGHYLETRSTLRHVSMMRGPESWSRTYGELLGEAVAPPLPIEGGSLVEQERAWADRLRKALDRALDDPTPPPRADLALISTYVRALFALRFDTPSPGSFPQMEDYDLLARSLADLRVDWRGIGYSLILGAGSERLAIPLMWRMEASRDRVGGRGLRSYFARAIADLPDGAAAPIAEELDRLAADPTALAGASVALSRLSDRGEAALPRLMELLTVARIESGPTTSEQREDREDAARAAARGLRRLDRNIGLDNERLLSIIDREVHNDRSFTDLGETLLTVFRCRDSASAVLSHFADKPDLVKHIAATSQHRDRQRCR